MSTPPLSAPEHPSVLDNNSSELHATAQMPSSDVGSTAHGPSLPASNAIAEHRHSGNNASADPLGASYGSPDPESSEGDTVAPNQRTTSGINFNQPSSTHADRRPENMPEHDRRTGSSNMEAGSSTRVSPTTRNPRQSSKESSSIPDDAEIIDVECLPIRTSGIKGEPIEIDDIMQITSSCFPMEGRPSAEVSGGPSGESKAEAIVIEGLIKKEPGDDNQNFCDKPTVVWGNCREDAVVLDDGNDVVMNDGTGLLADNQHNVDDRASKAAISPSHQQSSSYMPPRAENENPEIQHRDSPRNDRHALPLDPISPEVLEPMDGVRRFSRPSDDVVLSAHQDTVLQNATNAVRAETESSNLGRFMDKGSRSNIPSMSDVQQERIRQAQRVAKEKYLVQTLSHTNASAAPLAATSGDSLGTSRMENENARAAAAFAKASKAYERKKTAGTLTPVEEIEFIRLQRAETSRLKRLKDEAAWEQEHGGSLFVGNDSNGPSSKRPRQVASADDDEHEQEELNEAGEGLPTAKRLKPSLPRKAGMHAIPKHVKNASFLVGLEEEFEKNKKGKRAQRPTSAKKAPRRKSKSNSNDDPEDVGTKSTKKSDKAAKKSKGKSRKERPPPDYSNIDSLLSSNVFRDAEGNEAGPDQPTFDQTRRIDALKQLVASVPEEHRKTAQMDKTYLDAAAREFTGQRSVRSDGMGGWRVKGMKASLKHFQLLGGAFMRRRENSDIEPRGGLRADQMGLGKTVTMLANIANGQPPRGQYPKTTLIVAPAALCDQWFREIERHCDKKHIGRVQKQYGKGKLQTNDDVNELQGYDIVITTYNEVMRSYPKANFPTELQSHEEKAEWWHAFRQENQGILHQVQFLRIVLDEAQAIKNHKSHTSKACRALMGMHKWALSGTPVQNTIRELYPYFKFLGVPHTGSFRIFRKNFCSLDETGFERLHGFLNQFMIRRTHRDMLFGAPLVKLPQPTEQVHTLKFNDFERNVYEIVRRRMILKINFISKKGQLEKNYRNVLVMLLRLRQLTGHILSVEFVMRDLLELEDLEKLRELADVEAQPITMPERRAQILQLRKVLSGHTLDQAAGTLPAEQEDGPSNNNAGPQSHNAEPSVPRNRGNQGDGDVGGSHGLRCDFCEYLKSLRKSENFEEVAARTLCCVCEEPPDKPWITSCYHIYCQDCFHNLQAEAASRGQDKARCRDCGAIFWKAQPYNDSLLDLSSSPELTTSESEYDSQQRVQNANSKGKNRNGDVKIKDWIDQDDGDILPSSKTIAIKSQIMNWFEEKPDVKIIVYTQFIAIIRILSKVCMIEKWDHCVYHGGMTFEGRAKSIEDFANKPEKKILLASLKCGGTGLNLTMASRVICVDPWWNSSVEQQAFCRVFRIGQEQETFMTRFVVEKTVDQELIDLQRRKQAEIDQVMEDDGNRRRRLTIPDLLQLFGPVVEDDEGKPFILVDNKNTDLMVGADSDDEGLEDDP